MFAVGDHAHRWRLLLSVLISITFIAQALSAPAELQLENELLLELRLGGEKLGLDVLGYQREENFLLSLDELASGLGFAIAVDAAQGSASGWYISPERGFSLDIRKAEVISDGKAMPLAEGEAVVFQGGIYVETTALEKWFPLRLSAVVRELYLDVEPTEQLPLQQRFDRRSHVFTPVSSSQEAQYPLQDTPYQLFGPHITKLRLGSSSTRQSPDGSAAYNSNYALLARGDLGWMTSTIALAGKSDESVTGARLTLERTAFDGPLGLNHVEVGDVDAMGFLGLLVRGGGSREGQDGRTDNEFVTLEGNQLPDWDVELYQNDQLIDIQTTGQEGRYLFEDVQLQFGGNRFELKFFGPYGETETREEFYLLGVGMLEPGRIGYQLAAVQNGRTVFRVNDPDSEQDQDSGIYTGDFNLGLSRNLTVGAGITSRESNGERLANSNAGFGLSTSRLYGSVRYFDKPDAQNSISTSLRTRLGATSLSLGYTQFLDEPFLTSATEKWRSNVDITSTVFTLPAKLTFSTHEQEDTTQFDAVLGTTLPLAGSGRFSTSLWYNSVEERSTDSTTTTSYSGGHSSFHTTVRPWTFYLSASYAFKPENELLELSADSSLSIDRDLSLDLGIRQSATTDTTYYTGGINWQLDKVAVNARVSYDSDEQWLGLITLSTALVHQPGTLRPRLDSLASVDSGSVEVRVFEEANGAEEVPVAGVSVSGVQAWRKATTDDKGVSYLGRMPAHRQVDIELDDATLVDSDLRTSSPGVSIIPRPGSYALVRFPIARTTELEGHVVVADGDNEKPVSRALVKLLTPDGAVVAQRRTAFDGFYLFDGVVPGEYQVVIEDTLANRLIDQPGEITVPGNDDVVRGLDFTLNAAQEEKIILVESVVQASGSQEQPVNLASPPELGILVMAEPEVEAQAAQEAEEAQEGTWFVQLGAYGSRVLAQDFWDRVSVESQLLQGKTPRFTQYNSMTRLLVGPGLEKDAANQFCNQLKADRLDCIVRNIE